MYTYVHMCISTYKVVYIQCIVHVCMYVYVCMQYLPYNVLFNVQYMCIFDTYIVVHTYLTVLCVYMLLCG